MVQRYEVRGAGGVRLAAWEYAGQEASAGWTAPAASTALGPAGGRPGVLMLHGLLGRASHWAATARRLVPRYRAVALDQRGHGQSDKPDGPYTPDVYAADAIAAIEQLGLAPVTLIGHAMGALTAWQCAARRPDLVAAVVICDMRAAALGEAGQPEWERWLASWPLPFATLGDVRRWFAAEDSWADPPSAVRGEFFAEVMQERQDGWRPGYTPEHLLRSRAPWIRDAHWDELAQVGCPALVVRGLDGELGRAEAQEMVRVLPRGRYAEVADAGHLVPWDQPEAWHDTVEGFLREAVGPAGAVLGSAGAA
ncbi:alpha/beta fold hydrolase [Actinacidiphila sp. ITFR-21]|uniref:alpha/beta fold hydrolase n=1 Tax=Actinacidiphila sp. ITFR-21 TaxID=3075199 RepID=UPI00288B1A6B|nr:alpha/beta hydrolase [Streptomyces sp. ITFR-21]WNI15980.1 alpha/beta hydrolase [Streptomyces sp. ITFR-21]